MPCPGNDCKGYLSTQYKCELCKLYVCPDCFEIIGYSKEEGGHLCKEDNLKSAELIKKETKVALNVGFAFSRFLVATKCGVLNVKLLLVGLVEKLLLMLLFTILIFINICK